MEGKGGTQSSGQCVFRKWTDSVAGDAERIDHDEQVAADEIDRPVC
jgi:hypothetical protein